MRPVENSSLARTLTEYRNSPLYHAWNRLSLGKISLAEAMLYYPALAGAPKPLEVHSVMTALWRAWDKGQWDSQFAAGTVEKRFPNAFQASEGLWFRRRKRMSTSECPIWVIGFSNHSGVGLVDTFSEFTRLGSPVAAEHWVRPGGVGFCHRDWARASALAESAGQSFLETEGTFSPWLLRTIRHTAYGTFRLNAALEKKRPQLVILPDERRPIARAAAATAHAAGVPTASISYLADSLLTTSAYAEVPYSRLLIFPDAFFAEVSRGKLLSFPSVHANYEECPAARAPGSGAAVDRAAVFLGQALDGEMDLAKHFRHAFAERGIPLFFRPHPRQSRRWTKLRLGPAALDPSENFATALSRYAIFVTSHSVGGWHARQLGKPVILLSGSPAFSVLSRLSGVAEVRTPQEGANQAEHWLENPSLLPLTSLPGSPLIDCIRPLLKS